MFSFPFLFIQILTSVSHLRTTVTLMQSVLTPKDHMNAVAEQDTKEMA